MNQITDTSALSLLACEEGFDWSCRGLVPLF